MKLSKPTPVFLLIAGMVFMLLKGCAGSGANEATGGDPFAGLPVIDITDTLDITDDGSQEFFFKSRYFFGMAIAGNGDLLLFNNGAPNIYHFNSKGEFLSHIGREGDGPGEFRPGPGYTFDILGTDTLYVLENISWEVHAFAKNNAGEWSYTDGFSLEKRSDLRPDQIYQLDEKRLAITYGPGPRNMFMGNKTYDELSNTVQLVSTDGEVLEDSLLITPVNQFTTYRSNNGAAALIFPPFGMKSILDTGPEGSLYHVVTDTFLVQAYGTDGQLRTSIRQGNFTLDLGEELRNAAVEADVRVNMGSDAENRKMKEKVLGEIPAAAPPLNAMHADRDTGHLIVRRDSVFTGPNWMLMGRDGTRLGVFSLDPDLEVYDFRGGRIIGALQKDGGLPTVRLITLPREVL